MITLTQEIPLMSPVQGGVAVPGDWNKWVQEGTRTIRKIENAPPFSKHFAVPVEGQSLFKLGIHDGDILICRKTTRYIDGTIGIWETPDGRTAKLAYADSGSVVLHNSNGWRQSWSADEVKLIGIAIRVERDLI